MTKATQSKAKAPKSSHVASPDAPAPKGRNQPAQGNASRHAAPEAPSPKGATDDSPGQRPGFDVPIELSPEGARQSKWPVVCLGEIAEVKLGKMLDKTKHQTGVRLPYLRNVNVRWGTIETDDLLEMNFEDDQLDRFGLKANDVLVCEGGEPGRASVWNGHLPELKFQKALHRVRFKVPFDPRLLVYLLELLAKSGGLERRFTGSTIKHFTREAFVQLPIPFPPEADQRRIVAEIEKQFTRLEAGVAALRRVQASLKRYRAAVLKAACEGRLVPTEAELARTEGRPFESGQQLLARILTERRQNWQGRGKYKEPASLSASGYEPDAPPQGWTWATVSGVSSVIVDCPHSTAKFVSEGHPCLDTTCMKPGRVVREKLRYVTKATFDERVERLVPEANDIVFAREGTVGTAVAIPDDLRPCLGQRVMLMRPDSCILPAYFQHCLNSETVRHQYLPKIVGSTAPHINVAEVKMLGIPLPPLAEQTRIVAEVERRLSVVEELEALVTTNLQRATRLRQSILQKAFTGEF